MTDPKQTDMLTAEEIAHTCGVHRKTLLRWRAEGIFPPGIRFGRRTIRWPRATVQAFLDQQEKKQQNPEQ